MKKVLKVFFAVLILVEVFISCRSIQSSVNEPGLTLKSVEFAGISFAGVDMIAWVDVNNPNGFDLPSPKIAWELFVNSNSFLRGEQDEKVSIRRRRTTILPVRFGFSYEELYKSVNSSGDLREALYSITLGINFPLAEEKNFTLEQSGTIPLIENPRVRAGDFRISGIDFYGIDLAWDFYVENPNPFQIPFPNMEWEYSAGGVQIVKSSIMQEDTDLPAETESPVELTLGVKYADLITVLPSVPAAGEIHSVLSLNYEFPISDYEEYKNKLEISGVVPILSMPVFQVREINRKSLANQKFEFVVNMEIENKNSFPMNIEVFDYEIKVNNSLWARGLFQNPPVLKANSRTSLPLTVIIDAISNPSMFPLIVELHDIIQRGSSVSYVCSGDMVISSEFPGLPRLDLPVSSTGNSRLLQ